MFKWRLNFVSGHYIMKVSNIFLKMSNMCLKVDIKWKVNGDYL